MDIQDFDHILWSCPDYLNAREDMVEQQMKCNWNPPYAVSTFLKGPKIKELSIIDNFLKTNDLCI